MKIAPGYRSTSRVHFLFSFSFLHFWEQKRINEDIGKIKLSVSKKGKIGVLIASGVLGIFGGALIVTSGYRTQGLLLSTMDYANQHFGSRLPSTLEFLTGASIAIFAGIIALGGILVIIGGAIVIAGHTTTGRLLIALGGGVGFIGIATAIGFNVVATMGFDSILSHTDYWVGVVIASVARYLAKKAN